MSEEQTAIKQLLVILQQLHVSIQALTKNQECMADEQQLARKAVSELTVLVANHGLVLTELWNKSGLPPLDESETPPMTSN